MAWIAWQVFHDGVTIREQKVVKHSYFDHVQMTLVAEVDH